MMIDFPKLDAPDSKNKITIYIGGYHVSKQPSIVKTVLGSCISCCLYESSLKFGGMNHFMLPEVKDASIDDYNSTKYGIFAMEVLVNEIIKLGGKKSHMTAKIFGGGHVLSSMKTNMINVADKNIRFAEEFLRTEKIPIVSKDIGGTSPRKVFFATGENRVFLKKLGTESNEFSADKEITYSKSLVVKSEETSDLTLF